MAGFASDAVLKNEPWEQAAPLLSRNVLDWTLLLTAGQQRKGNGSATTLGANKIGAKQFESKTKHETHLAVKDEPTLSGWDPASIGGTLLSSSSRSSETTSSTSDSSSSERTEAGLGGILQEK